MKKINRLRTAAVVLACYGLFAVAGQADDAAPAAKAPVVVGRVAVGSQAQIAQVADELGIPLPAILTPAGVEQMFPFLGQGGFNPDLPAACDLLAGGADMTQAQRAIIYLPVTAGHAPIKDFLNNGEKMGDDGAMVNGAPMRRVGDYLLMSGVPDAIQAIKPEELLTELATHPLLFVSYNPKSLREADPKLWEQFKKSIQDNTEAPKNSDEAAGQAMAFHAITDGMDKLVMRLDKTADAFKFTTEIQPGPELTAKTLQTPSLPEDLAARVDMQLPADWEKSSLSWLRKTVGDKELYGDMKMELRQRKPFNLAYVDSLHVLLGGDTLSIGVGTTDHKPVFYAVTQSAVARDSHQDMKRICDEMNAIDTVVDHTGEVHLSQYADSAGEQVDRMSIDGDNGKAMVYIDCVDHGNLRLCTYAATENTAIEKLLTSKLDGNMDVAASGWVDLKQTLDMAAELSGKPMDLTDADHQLLDKVFKGQKINWTVATEKNQLNIAFDVPIALVKTAIVNGQQLADLGNRVGAKAGGN